MAAARPADLIRLTSLVRRCFQRLRALADELHGELGLSAALRAVLEAVHDNEARTVPQIARDKAVSRQHIQKIVDALLAGGLVVERANPGHRRSPLIEPTAKGRAAFARMRRREVAVVARLARRVDAKEVAAALAALQALDAGLSRELGQRPARGAGRA